MLPLTGKVALITGSAQGIGAGIAWQLAQDGADIAINYRTSGKQAIELVERIQKIGRKVIAIQADVSDVRQIQQMVDEVDRQLGKINILVNNSAIDPTIPFFEVTEEQWDRILDTNLKGTFFCAQACAKHMLDQGGGKIINISSVHGTLTMPRYAAYAASKGGMNALTRQLALDLAAHQIQVNAVAPGATDVEKFHQNPNHDVSKIGKQIPLGRIGYPDDVAKVVAFLASAASDFMTGQVLTVDGGSSTRFFLT
jgi:NAD(P)-dependent dehydrogenase (short-subunit alcohol dehydrogenase family)